MTQRQPERISSTSMLFSGGEHVHHDDDGTRERRSNVSRRKAAYDWLDWHGRNGSDVRERIFEGRLEEVRLAHDLFDRQHVYSLFKLCKESLFATSRLSLRR